MSWSEIKSIPVLQEEFNSSADPHFVEKKTFTFFLELSLKLGKDKRV